MANLDKMRSALPLYIVLSLCAFLTTALPSPDAQDPDTIVPGKVAVKRGLGEVENSGVLDPENKRQVLPEHPELRHTSEVDAEAANTHTLSIRLDDPGPALPREQWVHIPARCVRLKPPLVPNRMLLIFHSIPACSRAWLKQQIPGSISQLL